MQPSEPQTRPQCINPDIGKRVYLLVRERAPNQENVALGGEFEDHVRICPHCHELIPIWIIKAGGGLVAAADKLLLEVREGSPDILHRRAGPLDIYFKRKAMESSEGLMVRVREDGSIATVDETTINEFNSATVQI